MTTQELVQLVEETFLQADLKELAALCDTGGPLDATAFRAAMSYVEQWRLVLWTGDCNRRLGVAPSTESVLSRYEQQRLELPEALRPLARGTAASAQDRVWAGAWRRRWMVPRLCVGEEAVGSRVREGGHHGACGAACAAMAGGMELLSGGLGALGVWSACWLSEGGNAHVMLLSRSGRAVQGVEMDWCLLAGLGTTRAWCVGGSVSCAGEVGAALARAPGAGAVPNINHF